MLSVTFVAKTFAQLAGLRFLLGFFEAAMYPCCIMLISAMYRRREQAARLGIDAPHLYRTILLMHSLLGVVYICNGVAMAVGGFIGYGIGHMEGLHGHASWQWQAKKEHFTSTSLANWFHYSRMMIILGVVTIFFGFVCFFALIDDPYSRFLNLTPAMREIVAERQRDNAVVHSKETKLYQIKEALKEPRYYCFVIASMLINFQNGALNTFSTIITSGFGFTVCR